MIRTWTHYFGVFACIYIAMKLHAYVLRILGICAVWMQMR